MLRVMSFNIRFACESDLGDCSWESRKGLVSSMIRFHRPDIGGLQEVLFSQLKYLRDSLPSYGFIGVGRDDGKSEEGSGEYAPVFFKKTRFELLKEGHFWLSEDPSCPGSKSWGTVCTRLASFALLRDLRTKEDLVLLNTHLDHISEEAQVKGSELIMTKLNELCEERSRDSASSIPRIVVTGDFNSIPGSPPYLVFTRSSSAASSALPSSFPPSSVRMPCFSASSPSASPISPPEGDLSMIPRSASFSLNLKAGRTASFHPPHGSTGTFTGFSHPKVIDGREEPLLEIDFIFVDERTKVWQYGVLCDTFDGKLPSDHRPVIADLLLSEK